ncbi:MAG: AzlD domain-containing protein [Propionibacteriaceae bacterium]|nr:AzlD domain-containing protein [Micropruina sp.]HBX81658.1 branched-chain amino acid transporter AzlD [Propionibacteriaceae bacterium]HBY24244.1 branched-chain amino acid transporter AzlD [Propionibacteriaceae bacterium]
MTDLWMWVLLACATAFAIKLSGYLLPRSVLDRPFVPRLAGALTVGLLASLTITNTVASGQRIALDSRLLGLAAGAVCLKFKLPYIVVVLAGAVATAVGRAAGLP